MFATLLRLGALIAVPLVATGAAAAQYDAPQDEAALILFSGANYTGDAVNIFDPIHALPDIRFNDRARSVAVLSGAWEICEHSDFTGRCVFLREDVPDLRYFDLGGDVSSVRPIYEYTDAEHGLMFVRDERGYIQYADAVRYGNDDYDYGYGRTTRVEVYHYGYSPAYRSYGYYDPLAGYGPYGFGYSRGGYNTYRSYHRERPPLRGHYGARNADATLYVDSNGRGASLGINRGVKDLSRFRFNDNVSSLNIKSGKWEVCEHANFQGRCEIIDASTGKLNGYRLNDNISSIRPVGDTRPATGRPGKGDRDGDRDRDRDSRRDGQRDGDAGRTRRPQAASTPPVRSRGSTAALAGGPGTVTSLPDTTPSNRQRRATRSVIPSDPVSNTVRDPRTRGGVNPAVRAETQRVRPVTEQPRRSQVRAQQTRVEPVRAPRSEAPRVRPQQQGQRIERSTRQQVPRALPQTPAMRSQAPARAQAQPAQQTRVE
ncbi:beta/gamma crystallin-related protein, partial [Hyphomonas sp.]|uniref:beta/gamma crystallin-related protein n=1 Tax=Hyphomonas sp. TaxID=87 RepID=UPI0030FA1ABD